jgi:hypothetical protein
MANDLAQGKMSPGVRKRIYDRGLPAYRTKADNRTSPCPTELLYVAANLQLPAEFVTLLRVWGESDPLGH